MFRRKKAKCGQSLSQITITRDVLGTSAVKAFTGGYLDHLLDGWISEESVKFMVDDIDKVVFMNATPFEGNRIQDLGVGDTSLDEILEVGDTTGSAHAQYSLERPFVAILPANFEGHVRILRKVHRRVFAGGRTLLAGQINTLADAAPTTGGSFDSVYINKVDIECKVVH